MMVSGSKYFNELTELGKTEFSGYSRSFEWNRHVTEIKFPHFLFEFNDTVSF